MKNVPMCYIEVTEGKIENLKKECKMRISILIFIYTIHFAYLKCIHDFIILNQVVAEKTDQKQPYVLYRNDRRKIEKEGKMSFSIFIFIYTIHLAYLKVCTKFKNTGSNRSREICERNFHWRERKMNK